MNSTRQKNSINRLNLGCGRDVKEGFINIDKEKYEEIDILCNLGHEKLPFGDNSVDYVYAKSFIEHLDTYEMAFLLEELYRVCKHGAFIEFIVPHYLSPSSCRVFHKQRISEGYFNDYDVNKTHSSLEGKKYFKISWRMNYQRYRPKGMPFFLILPCNIYFKLQVVKAREG